MRSKGPNWGLAFGSASFLIVWLLGLLANVPIDVVSVRATIATILGAVVGLLLGQAVEGLAALMKQVPTKGQRVDFTVASDDNELHMPPASELERIVPEASPHPKAKVFQPLDFNLEMPLLERVLDRHRDLLDG